MNNRLIHNLNKLPKEVIEIIFFMANPRLRPEFQKELKLESAHMMCEQHYKWWYCKIKQRYPFLERFTYHYMTSFIYYFSLDELQFIKQQLYNCECCERHSNRSIDTGECNIIRTNPSLRALRQMKNYCGPGLCRCPCRHIIRQIERVYIF
tara:strand:+ start:9831 stop:10283 length:453 start_codon:yes stop_codon:yes gene_type:complete